MTQARCCTLDRARTRSNAGRLLILAGLLAVAGADPAGGAEFMAGADISSLPVHEASGAVYRANGQAGDAIEIFSDHGVNWYRLRLFVDPKFQNNYNGGYDPFVAQDLDYTIALAQRVKQAGGKLLLDFHYSDTWADPGHQAKPEAWQSLSFSQLEQQVYYYTKQSIEAFKTAGVLPEMVQIGNEIPSGFLWNDGRLWRPGIPESTQFDNLATLLSAGIRGARDGAGPGDEPLVMIHHDKGSQWGTTSYYFDRLLPRLESNSAEIDVLGYSYYPKWHSGGMAGVEENLNLSVRSYGKPVVVVETGFASRCPTCEPEYEFEVSAAGQEEFLQTLVDVVQDVQDGMGWGVFWWYAEARPTSGLPVWEGGRYGLFDQTGNLLPAANVFAALNTGVPGDFNDDGFVDAADYVAWRAGLGTEYQPADYEIWRAGFGNSSGSGAAAQPPVPEPSTLVLTTAILAVISGSSCRSSLRARRLRGLQTIGSHRGSAAARSLVA